MRRKRRSTIIKNVENINMEIDYDKLAEAIVKANNRQNNELAEREEINLSAKERLNIFKKGIIQIITCKNKTNNALTTGVFAIAVSLLFRAVALFGLFVVVVLVKVLYDSCCEMTWTWGHYITNVFVILSMTLIGIAILLYSLIVWGSATEIENEKDKNYIVSLFSGIVGFVALIIAFVALRNDIAL